MEEPEPSYGWNEDGVGLSGAVEILGSPEAFDFGHLPAEGLRAAEAIAEQMLHPIWYAIERHQTAGLLGQGAGGVLDAHVAYDRAGREELRVAGRLREPPTTG